MFARRSLVAGLLLGVGPSAVSAAAEGAVDALCADGEATSLLQAAPKKALSTDEEEASCLECAAGHFETLSGYTGSLEVTGTVHVTAVKGQTDANNRQILSYDLSGVDPRCAKQNPSKPDSCTAYLTNSGNVGVNPCDFTGVEGDHVRYYNSDARASNPWDRVKYYADGHGDSAPATACSLATSVKTGLRPEVVPGLAVVLLDYDSTPYACAPVGKGVPAKAPLEYEAPKKAEKDDDPFYFFLVAKSWTKSGAESTVSGEVYVSQANHCPETPSQYLAHHLSGVDSLCSKGPRPGGPFSCALVVFDGTCESLGEPLYNTTARDVDPWLYRGPSYTTYDEGLAADTGAQVVTGYGLEPFKGKPLVVFGSDPEPEVLGCAILES